MRVVFIGASSFGLKCLKEVCRLSCCEVVGVVTAPKTFSISYSPENVTNVLHTDFHDFCSDDEIPCESLSQGMNDNELLRRVSMWQPDIFVVVGWYHLVPKAWLNLASAYGLHASLLPKYSGGAPLVWSIINGEREAGISLFQFGSGVDSGPIAGQSSTVISLEDTIATLYARIEILGLDLIREFLPKIVSGEVTLIEQNESERTTYPQRSPADGLIDWSASACRVYDFIRAQTKPYPGAFFMDGKDQITVWRAQKFDAHLSNPLGQGEVRYLEMDGVVVGCGNNTAIRLIEIAVNGEDKCVAERFRKCAQ